MSHRHYPRNEQSRQAHANQGRFNVRNEQSRLAGLNSQPSVFEAAGIVVTSNSLVSEAALRAGGVVMRFEIKSNVEKFAADLSGAVNSAWVGALTGGGAEASDIVFGELARVSDKVATLEIDASVAYNSGDGDGETIQYGFDIPATAFQYRETALAANALRVAPVCDVTVSGTIEAGGVVEGDIVTGGETIVFTIVGNDTFASDLVTNATKRNALIEGLTSDDAADIEAAFIQANFVLSAGNTILTITLPAVAAYSIAGDDEIGWVIPASAFTARGEELTVVVGTVTNA
jgi:hypothetical protein